MGCFLACFGGDGGDRRRRRRRSRRQSPATSPPRSIHVAVVRDASVPVVADVVVKEVSPPLRGAKPSTLAAAVKVPDEVVPEAAVSRTVDGVVKEEASSPPLHGAKDSTPPPLHVAKDSTPPPAVVVADEAVADASPSEELRELTEQKASPLHSLLPEKQATPPLSPVKCSPIAAASVPPQDSVESSPVVAAVVSTPDSELREVGEHGSRSSGKKKVTFDMNVTTYENTVQPDEEEESLKEDEKYAQKTMMLPENHRYRNCSDSDDDFGDEYAEDDVYDFDSDEEDFVDCKIDLVDEEDIRTEDNKQESHESLFSLSMSNDQKNDQEVISPAPKSGGTTVEAESPLITRNALRDRSQYAHPVLNPVQNLSEWKEVKNLKTQPVQGNKLDKENVNSVPNVGASHQSNSANQSRMSPSISSKKEVSVDASLSTWLVSSENSTVEKVRSKSPCSVSSVSREEQPVLGALTIDDLKLSSATSSPRSSPSHNRGEAPILGTVDSYWRFTKQENEYCSSRSDSGTNGIPNTTSKYREDKKVNWHSTPFNVRLDRALRKTSA